jgi:hypothetical protein
MGNQEASTKSTDSIMPYWQENAIKFVFPGERMGVEEIKTPWDLYVEGRWQNSSIGNEFHQALVRNGVERIFSIRDAHRRPYCEILTRPQESPVVSIDWAPRRGLNTSSPMTIDGQKLIVLDVIAMGGRRVEGPVLQLAKDFFLSQGGVLRGEHPNGLVFSDPKTVREWQAIVEKNVKIDLVISSHRIKDKEFQRLRRPHIVHGTNLELAVLLLESRYWHRCHLNGDEEWISNVVAHMENEKDDQPAIINVYGKSDHAKAIFERVKTMFEQGKKK